MKALVEWSRVKSDLFVVFVLATAALALGLAINQFRDKPLSFVYKSKATRLEKAIAQVAVIPDQSATPAEKTVNVPEKLSLQQIREYIDKKQGLVLDARPEIFHRLGHIPGALTLARDEFEKSYDLLKDVLEANKAQPLVVYCSSNSCEDAELVHMALTRLGYNNVGVFAGGWSEWTAAGLPEERKE